MDRVEKRHQMQSARRSRRRSTGCGGTARQRVSRLVHKALSCFQSFEVHELWLRLFLICHSLQPQCSGQHYHKLNEQPKSASRGLRRYPSVTSSRGINSAYAKKSAGS
jgi:hypothetical protein